MFGKYLEDVDDDDDLTQVPELISVRQLSIKSCLKAGNRSHEGPPSRVFVLVVGRIVVVFLCVIVR